jgi:hypothetical protein
MWCRAGHCPHLRLGWGTKYFSWPIYELNSAVQRGKRGRAGALPDDGSGGRANTDLEGTPTIRSHL